MYKFHSPLIVQVPQDLNLTPYAQVCWLCCVLYMPLFCSVQVNIRLGSIAHIFFCEYDLV